MNGSFGPRGYTPDDGLIIVMQIEGSMAGGGVRGSQQIVADCGHEAWLSPSGIGQTLKMPELRTICVACWSQDERLHKQDREAMRAEGAVEELQQELGDNYPNLMNYVRSLKEW